ncbi:DEAD/DEAH box helicase [Candidatus Woesearchaeota archaeon]|nr:DEAD/DEAH box helicase [Candidatus Woesearchaeota archaeon]
MSLTLLDKKIPTLVLDSLKNQGITELRPAQTKALKAGLLEGKNLLVCTPTASGKTLIAELAMLNAILNGKGRAVYISPLKALASEKYREFRQRYGHKIKIALSIGDIDSSDGHLANYDLIFCTAEKLDSLTRHHSPWLKDIAVVVCDELHLLNDPSRGPTLEILLTILRDLVPDVQVIALSATIGNPKELAEWLDANLVVDSWRPVKLHQGIYFAGKVEFEE